MSDYGLIDIWRLDNPEKQHYSYYSPNHKSYSRIDYFLTNKSLTPRLTNPARHGITISDHAPISITFQTNIPPPPPPGEDSILS